MHYPVQQQRLSQRRLHQYSGAGVAREHQIYVAMFIGSWDTCARPFLSLILVQTAATPTPPYIVHIEAGQLKADVALCPSQDVLENMFQAENYTTLPHYHTPCPAQKHYFFYSSSFPYNLSIFVLVFWLTVPFGCFYFCIYINFSFLFFCPF